MYSLLCFPGFKCPVCSKSVASNEMEVHFIMCLSKPRLSYNGKEALPLPFLCMAGGLIWDVEGKVQAHCCAINTELILALALVIFIGLPNIVPSLQFLLLC